MMVKKKNLGLIVLLLLVTVTFAGVAGTYAKYTAEITGKQGTATVAKWAFDTENQNKTLNVELAPTADATTLVANKIAPGTSGSFAINLSNANSEVGVDFTVGLGNATNVPTNLKFYKDAAHTTELTPGTSTITGQIIAGDTTGVDVTIYWAWEYETGTVTDGIATGDADDTANGRTGSTMTLPLTIKGVQTQPSSTAITSHIN